MITRRQFAAATAAGLRSARRRPRPRRVFPRYLAGVRAQARRAGVSDATIARAFAGLQPDQKVLDLNRHQPEFTLTWAQYRARVLSPGKLAGGRAAFAANRSLLLGGAIAGSGVTPDVVVGHLGHQVRLRCDHRQLQRGAVAGDARPGKRPAQLLPLRAGRGAAHPRSRRRRRRPRMTGSYAGAMGQPQFMPDSYLRYAVDFDGDGRRDIWTSRARRARLDRQLPRPQRLARMARSGASRCMAPAGNRPGAGRARTAAQPRRMDAARRAPGGRRRRSRPTVRARRAAAARRRRAAKRSWSIRIST